MAYIQKDRVKETTVTNGTGAITLAGAAVGFQAFSAVMSVSDTCYYVIVSATGADWETGTGTYSSASVLTRTTVLSSSNSGNAVSFTSGTKDVFMGPVAERVTDIAHGGTGATTAAGARTNLGVGTGTVTSASVVSANGFGGTVATATTTPAITLTTSITGVLKGNATAISAAIAGTDYLTPSGSAANLTNFPTLNQNTTGNAATVTTNANLTGHVTSTGNATVLGSFTSAQLLGALTDETGTGANVFATSPTLVTPLSNTLSSVPVTSGAGNSLTIAAGSGVTSGAGGSLILQAGLQATSGGDGKVIVKQVAGQTSSLQEWQNSAGTVLSGFDSAGRLRINSATNTGAAANNSQIWVRGGTNRNFNVFDTGGIMYVSSLLDDGSNYGTMTLKASVLTLDSDNGLIILAKNTSVNTTTSQGSFTVKTATDKNFAVDNFTRTYSTGARIFTALDNGNNAPFFMDGLPIILNSYSSVNSPSQSNVGIGNRDIPLAKLHITTDTLTKVGQIVQGAASQTANLQEWQNSAGTVLASVSAAGVVKTIVLTVATLPAAATAGAGARAFVSDSNATTFAAIVAGGGANGVPVYSNGTDWRIG